MVLRSGQRLLGGVIPLERSLVKHQVRVRMGNPEQPKEEIQLPIITDGGIIALEGTSLTKSLSDLG